MTDCKIIFDFALQDVHEDMGDNNAKIKKKKGLSDSAFVPSHLYENNYPFYNIYRQRWLKVVFQFVFNFVPVYLFYDWSICSGQKRYKPRDYNAD